MKIEKKHLTDLEMAYAITTMNIDGRTVCLCASEQKNRACLLIDLENNQIQTLWEKPGGVMSLVPVAGENAFLSIEQFYPIFDSAKAEVIHNQLSLKNGRVDLKRTKLCDLPYAHRIALLQAEDGKYLVGASLCEKKNFTEDWSYPGGVFVGAYRQDQPIVLTELYHGLTKNHGMFLRKLSEKEEQLFVGASEGILEIKRTKEWHTKLFMAGETSDICYGDFDGDGKEEMAVIQGFHGNCIRILKEVQGKLLCIGELPLDFGHVLWCGTLFDELYLIGGSRGGKKELTLYRVHPAEKPEFEILLLDEGTGATQITVLKEKNCVRVLAANHGIGSVDSYTLTP